MTTLTINGATYTVDHNAISRNSGDGVEYYTTGKDSAGNSVEIVWDTLAGWDYLDPKNEDNEENACNWDVANVEITEEVEKPTLRTIVVNGINFSGINFSARVAGLGVEMKIDGSYFGINNSTERQAREKLRRIRKAYSFIAQIRAKEIMGAPKKNQNARKPAEMRVDGAKYTRLNINIPQKVKSEAVRAAYPGNLTKWIIDAIERKLKNKGS